MEVIQIKQLHRRSRSSQRDRGHHHNSHSFHRRHCLLNIFLILMLTFQFHTSQAFFLPKFMRRQAMNRGAQEQQQQLTTAVRNIQSYSSSAASAGNAYRVITNTNNNPPPANFHVPDALCLACDRFPWTPVPGSGTGPGTGSSSSVPVPVGAGSNGRVPVAAQSSGNDNNLDSGSEPESVQQQQSQHFELQIHKEVPTGASSEQQPITHVVYNDLSASSSSGPSNEQGNRQPYAFAFDGGAVSQRKPTLLQPAPRQPQPQTQSHSQGSQPLFAAPPPPPPSGPGSFAQPNQQYGTILLPQDNKATLLQPAPGNYRPHPNSIGGGPSGPSYFQYGPPSPQQPGPSQQPQSYKIPPIDVGTIIAAQHNLKLSDIQPAKLIYQEHTHLYAPSQSTGYGVPKPKYGPVPAAAATPQSYKMPIVNNRPTLGAIKINPVPLDSVPNYAPPPNSGNYGAPSAASVLQPVYQSIGGFMNPPAPIGGASQGQGPAQGYGQPYLPPPPQPPASSQRRPRPLPPRPLQGYRPVLQQYAPQPQSSYQQQHQQNQQQQQQVYRPIPAPPIPIPQKPSTLYAQPMPELEMRPPPQQQQQYFFSSQPQQQLNYGAQAPQNLAQNQNSDGSGGIDPRIKPQSFSPGEYSQQSIQVLQTEVHPKPSALPSPPTIPFRGQVNNGVSNEDSEEDHNNNNSDGGLDFRQNPHLQSVQQSSSPTDAPTNAGGVGPSLPATGGGRWEIVPATQYDITHLFNKQNQLKAEEEEINRPPLPIPVPVPIPETHVANSAAPLFVVQHNGNNQENRQEDGSTSDLFQPVRLETTIHTTASASSGQGGTGSGYGENTYGQSSQFDPLPSSVVRALYNSQRTSFLTHQHLTPEQSVAGSVSESAPAGGGSGSSSGPLYVNSVTVNESPVEETRQNSIVSSAASASSASQGSDQDQTVVNCQNSPQWLIPTTANFNGVVGNRNPFQQQFQSESAGTVAQNSKPFIYYYPAPMSSVYWTERPRPTTSGQLAPTPTAQTPFESQQQQAQQIQEQEEQYRRRPEPMNRIPIRTILQHQYANVEEANAAAELQQKSTFRNPYVKLSTTIVSSNSISSNDNNNNNNYNNGEDNRADGDSNYSAAASNSNGEVINTSNNGYYYTVVKQQQREHSPTPSVQPSPPAATQAQTVEDDESEEDGSSSIIQQVSTQPPSQFDILNFAQDPVFDNFDVASESSTFGTSTTDTTSTTTDSSIVYFAGGAEDNNNNKNNEQQEFKPQISFKSFSSLIPNNKLKIKSAKFNDNNGGGNYANNFEIIGPTTLAECFKAATAKTEIPPTGGGNDLTTMTTMATTTGGFPPTTTDSNSNSVAFDDEVESEATSTTTTLLPTTFTRIRYISSSRFPSGRPSPTTPIPAESESINVPVYHSSHSTTESEDIQPAQPPLPPPFSRISSTSRKVAPGSGGKNSFKYKSTGPIIIESVPVVSTTTPVSPQLSGEGSSVSTTATAAGRNISTKIVKTVRVRQRMRPGSTASNSGNRFYGGGSNIGVAGSTKRVKIIQRPASEEYLKNFPEYALPEGDTLGEEEAKEVKNALIDLKKID